MVSLVNFKSVDDDLHRQQQQRLSVTCATNQRQADEADSSETKQREPAQLEVRIFNQEPSEDRPAKRDLATAGRQQQQQTNFTDEERAASRRSQNLKLVVSSPQSQSQSQNKTTTINVISKSATGMFCSVPLNGAFPPEKPAAQQPCDEPNNFVVTWRSLRFAIEPKWHQRLASSECLSSVANFGNRRSQQQQRPAIECGLEVAAVGNVAEGGCQSAAETKVVLDLLDGSFKSGELTAILGPSGAGKTTLLDCLTGHRKHGLSGSIRISSSPSSTCGCYCCPASGESKSSNGDAPITYSQTKNSYLKQKHDRSHHNQPSCASASGSAGNGDNLKVSIIPQNDHLMGHLTVYETLNYASKMKNCFERQFDHKLNIRRVAQQLGLMSCLGTRINKLSGGQYKRVSIAQELLSSPDILILDEPTSGLDAMTCYQTVQVLRKLTDDRQTSGQNPIAVILTIHQPNSDVFQQFNHVYVVAQGGKCIYEGPPSSIESVINRVGIRLPNSYYNPATMIVEIAAGKFGTNAILELNDIQKKQYDLVGAVSDEQTSTGDSAVDCPSSSSSAPSSTASNDEDDCDDADADAYKKKLKRTTNIEMNNNAPVGLVNEGFVMDNEPNNNSNGKEEVIVIVRESDSNISADREPRIKQLTGGNASDLVEADSRRRKRRRTRKRSGDPSIAAPTKMDSSGPLVCANFAICPEAVSGSPGGGDGNGSSTRAEKRLKLNSLKADQKFPFWRHTYLHFHRSWLSIVRDPMLCSMQLALHIIVPVMVSLVYGTNVGKPNACPRAGPMDIMAYALEPTDSALQLQEDLRTTLENIGYIFFKLYGIIFAAMTVTVLTFPLDMHVLVKEFRNGWYGLSSYFLGRTLADIPFQLTLPLLAMSLSYYATGQPYSYFQWRFLSITGILILSSLIAQSQGLLFGAILMDRMKAAVFVAPAATTPIILFAGFLVRTQSIPHYLRPLSNLSYLRYAIEACLISRYGFNQCECDPAVFNQTVPELPPIARSMLDYWLSSFKPTPETNNAIGGNSTAAMLAETTTLASSESTSNPDLFTKLLDSLGKANSFGRNITSCEQVVPYPMIDYDLKDSQLFSCFAILMFMLVFTRLLTFFIVCFKVKRKV